MTDAGSVDNLSSHLSIQNLSSLQCPHPWMSRHKKSLSSHPEHCHNSNTISSLNVHMFYLENILIFYLICFIIASKNWNAFIIFSYNTETETIKHSQVSFPVISHSSVTVYLLLSSLNVTHTQVIHHLIRKGRKMFHIFAWKISVLSAALLWHDTTSTARTGFYNKQT